MTEQGITIGICAYNAARTIQVAINSIVNQSASWHELIVLDDGSTDETHALATEIADRYASRIRVLRQVNRGIGEARNRVLAEAKGAWLAFVDTDDVWHPMKLARQIACLHRHPEWGALVTRAWAWKDGEDPMEQAPSELKAEPHAVAYPMLAKQLLSRNFDFHPASVLWRTKTLRIYGGYGHDRNGEDFAPFLSMAMARVPVGILDEKLYGGRIAGGSLTRLSTNHYQGAMARIKAIDAWLSNQISNTTSLSNSDLKLLNEGRQRFLRWAIYGLRSGFRRDEAKLLARPIIAEIEPSYSRHWEWLKFHLILASTRYR